HFAYLGKFPALCGIDFTVSQKEKIALIGANGSGKSTLLHLLDGLIFSDKGIMRAFGHELKEGVFNDQSFSRDFRKKVGLVFQNPEVQLFCPTVREDIVFGPLQLGMDKATIAKRLENLIAVIGIEDLLERSPHQLSIGEKRKVAIASTLIIDPEVLLLDEPTAGLDPLTTRHIVDLLIQEHKSGKTLIVSTHDLHIVEELADTVYVVGQKKRIVKSGTPQAILGDFQLLQAHNLIHIHRHTHEDTAHVHPHLHTEHH
ncbi:MAG: ABC transporter ATP-binding protein, partial [Candidatus Omnitrophota bacterium]